MICVNRQRARAGHCVAPAFHTVALKPDEGEIGIGAGPQSVPVQRQRVAVSDGDAGIRLIVEPPENLARKTGSG